MSNQQQPQRNTKAIAQLLEAELNQKAKLDNAKQNGAQLIRSAKETAMQDITKFEKSKNSQIDDQRKKNNDMLLKTKDELNKKVEIEVASIKKVAQQNMDAAVELLVKTVIDV